MWFDDDEVTDRRLVRRSRNRRRPTVLRVRARTSVEKRRTRSRLALAIVGLVVVGGFGVLTWSGLQWLGGVLFSRNGRYEIRTLDIKVDGNGVMTPALVKEYTQLREGLNLFECHIGQIREEFLRRAHTVKSMEISRILPDTLAIEVVERIPLARLGRRGYFVADHDGRVFVLRTGSRHLPVIQGYKGPRLRSGMRVSGMALAALQVLDACDDPMLGLSVDAVEADRSEYVVLWLAGPKTVRLSWPGMGELTPSSRRHLQGRLRGVVDVLGTERGRRLSKIDATTEGEIFGR